MSSWNIIKENLIIGTKPKSIDRDIALNQSASLLASLRQSLIDYDEAVKDMNKDDDLRSALFNQRHIDNLRKKGVI